MIIDTKRLVGVLLDPNSQLPFSRNRVPRIYRELYEIAALKKIQLIFFFSKDFNLNQGYVSGWLLLNDYWQYTKCLAPRVIYNRISYRSLENREYNQSFFSLLHQAPGYTIFNTRYLNKLEIFESFKGNQQLKASLPATDLFSPANLSQYLQRYPAVFLKPNSSSRGEGIIKIHTAYPDYYHYKKYTKGKSSPWYRGSQNEVIKHISKMIGSYRYILQEGISLCSYKDQVFDLRAQAQKNRRGNWELTGYGVRLAAPRAFVTHIPNGGKLKRLHEVFDYRQCEQVEKDLSVLCLTAAPLLEKKLKLHLGILSFDVGIENSTHQLKLFEINSKPATFDETLIRKRHWELLVDYFCYLLNSDQHKENERT